jgi:hypothetical protein
MFREMRWPTDESGLALHSDYVLEDAPAPRGHETNTHHLQHPGAEYEHYRVQQRKVGAVVLFLCLRDLQTRQDVIPVNQHEWINDMFMPPKMLSEVQAYEELERAFFAKECFRKRMTKKQMAKHGYKHDVGAYALVPFTEDKLLQCKQDCDMLIRLRAN